jgi:four helix bundle suffix protein
LPRWSKDDPQAREVRALGKEHPSDRSDPTDQSDAKGYDPWLRHAQPGVVANALICLIHQANYLLDHQIRGLERQFIQGGGYSERLAAARLEERKRADQPEKGPVCSACGKAMVLRTARKGAKAGSRFWGCVGYPECRGTLHV